MPKKFNDYDDDSDYLLNIPITERITTPQTDTVQNKTEDMLSEIVDERTKMKNTSMMEMVGVLTTVTYYRSVKDPQNNYASDSNGPNGVAFSFGNPIHFRSKIQRNQTSLLQEYKDHSLFP